MPSLMRSKAGLVHVERGELDLVADAGLADRVGGAVGVAGADGDDAVDGRGLSGGWP